MIRMKRKNFLTYHGFRQDRIIERAEKSLGASCVHITDTAAECSRGTAHDYYSNGDYWWPNPETEDGLPYVRRDGESNPRAFFAHRIAMRKTRTNIANLAAGYKISGDERYAEKAVRMLYEFFLDPTFCMAPNLRYAQAVPGVSDERGIGIIDGLHMIDIPFAIETLRSSPFMTPKIYSGLREWFSLLLNWLMTSKNGREERIHPNNHSICFYLQAAVYAVFTENTALVEECRRQYREFLIPLQQAPDGSFPQELARTKPYSYSIFVLDSIVALCHVLSDSEEENLWRFDCGGRTIQSAVEFLYPYLKDKNSWPYPRDIEHFESLPVRMPFMLFAGCALPMPELIELYEALPEESQDTEVRRNVAIRQPILWL